MAQTTESDTPPAFPKLLALPAVERPVRVPVATFAEVRTAADLPDRLLLGDLVPESFRHEKKGWSAEWIDADGHRARFRYAGGLSALELAFRGNEAVTLTTAERFAELTQTVQTIHPGAWLDILGRHLEGQYNLRVFPHREDDAVGGDFPDGHLLTLVMAVPADRLMALFDLHKRLAADAAIRTGITAYLRLAFSVVNYIEGRNPAMLAHPAGLVLHHVNALGTPAAEMPVRETDAEGVAAWTLRRSHYLYVAHLHLREAARLVSRLAEAGYIGQANAAREGWPHAPEFGALLLPFGYEYAAKNAYWFDRDRRRRMFYPAFADANDRNALVSHSSEVWIRALIRDAQKRSERLKAETARAFAEGLAKGMGRPERGLH
ncbi:MAG: hypothetical protein ACUVT2_03165 [Thiobacillaceae bacterium]